MRAVTKWVSFDNEEFLTEAECRRYESGQAHTRLVGLTIEQIAAALDREHEDHDPGLAEAIEQVGTTIARARRDAGDLKRTRKPKAADAPQAGIAQQQDNPMVEAMRPDDSATHPPRDMVAEHTAEMEERRQARVAEGLPGALHEPPENLFVEGYSEKEPA